MDPHLEPLREYILTKHGAEEGFPFGPEVMVFKVGGKMFALMSWENNPLFVNLKCDPERSALLREDHEGITPGYHMNKKLWNSVVPGASVSLELVEELVDHSYDLIVASLTKKARLEFGLE
ncbi:MAG: MmcQ/YjbR family DNA-binding protein [bacterium]|nr:MmcQ/YjbR family DNA-binding protein [bacterium]